jgi:hypothetical protein
MDIYIHYAIRVFFFVAIAAPTVLVILYRWRDIPLRRAEVEAMMESAFQGPDPAANKAAQEALDSNPYISNPRQTFDRYHSILRYALPVLVLAALTVSSGYIVYSWVDYYLVHAPAAGTAPSSTTASAPDASSSPAPASPNTTEGATRTAANATLPLPNTLSIPARLPGTIIMALIGGYIWCVFQIIARGRSWELSPDDLYGIDLGLLAAIPVGIAFSLLTADVYGLRSFMAFSASAFPLRDVQRLFRQFAMRKALEPSDKGPSATISVSRPAELHLGTAIEGLSDETLARLSELGVSTVLDMAYCDPIKVMVQSGFALPVIIDWVDQSLWALYAGELKSKINKLGIRCSLDACEFVDLHLSDEKGEKKATLDGDDKAALDALAQAMGSNPILLKDLMFRIDVDPQVLVLRRLWYPEGMPKDLQASAAGAK